MQTKTDVEFNTNGTALLHSQTKGNVSFWIKKISWKMTHIYVKRHLMCIGIYTAQLVCYSMLYY